MRFTVTVLILISLTLAGCSAQGAEPEAATAVPGMPDLQVSIECTEDNMMIFEIYNAGDGIPSEGWAYSVVDANGQSVEEGGTSLGSDETEAIVMDDAGPYTLIMPEAGINQEGACPIE